MAKPDPRTVLDDLRNVEHVCLAAELRTANRLVTKFYAEKISPSGLSAAQFSLLLRLYFVKEATMIQLAERMEIDRTTMARNVALLEKGGFVDIATGEDRRARIVTLTDHGFETLLEALPKWVEAQEEMQKLIGKSLWDNMLADCRALIEATDTH